MKESSVFKPDSSVLDSDTRYPLDLCVLESEVMHYHAIHPDLEAFGSWI